MTKLEQDLDTASHSMLDNIYLATRHGLEEEYTRRVLSLIFVLQVAPLAAVRQAAEEYSLCDDS